ncbi:MAG: gliding motility-associated C-terminal domain-containing protein [Flavobacteriales bacterium]|nr:gliding motility-associated C-terminal domain-containing protein [Flavobacteriales bacterium]
MPSHRTTDGINDGFKVVGAEQDEFELSIFNRWGESVFNSVDPGAAWDGSYSGAMVPDGTYVYMLRYRDSCNGTGRMERIGHVTVLR